jgi:hypothetical protein
MAAPQAAPTLSLPTPTHEQRRTPGLITSTALAEPRQQHVPNDPSGVRRYRCASGVRPRCVTPGSLSGEAESPRRAWLNASELARKALGRGEERAAGVVVPLASLSCEASIVRRGAWGAPLSRRPGASRSSRRLAEFCRARRALPGGHQPGRADLNQSTVRFRARRYVGPRRRGRSVDGGCGRGGPGGGCELRGRAYTTRRPDGFGWPAVGAGVG